MTYETLQYTDANNVTREVALQNLSALGTFKHWMIPKSHAPSEYHILLPQPPENAPAIPFLSQCKVFACRQSPTGEENSFIAGQILFQGRLWNRPARASAKGIQTELVFYDALKDLERLTYQTEWNYISGGTNENPVFSIATFPDVTLFASSPAGQLQPNGTFAPYNPAAIENTITSWQQLMAIVFFAKNYIAGTQAVQIQMGTNAEFTPSYCNYYTARAISCLDAIKDCLRVHPLVYSEMDYTTTPPTLHFRYVGNMTPVTLPYKGTDPQGNVHIATDIQPLPELVPSRVVLQFQETTTINGKPQIAYVTEIYPNGATAGLLEENYSINIKGPEETQTSKTFISYAFSPINAALWRIKVPSLKQIVEGGQIPNDGNTGSLEFVSTAPYDPVNNPKGIQVIDALGNPIDYTNTFIYFTDEAVYDWFQAGSVAAQKIHATVKAFFTYQRQTTVGAGANATALTPKMLEHEHSMRVTLTNMPSATYTLTQAGTTGEAIPTNLAQNVWTELQWLQYKIAPHENWQVGPDQNTAPQIIKPGKNTINLSGGDPAWTAMNAVPENVRIEFFRVFIGGTSRLAAKHSISCGPVDHLSPQYRVELMNLFRNRLLRDINPNQRLTGVTGNTTDLSAEDFLENSVPSPELPAILNIASIDPVTGTVNPIVLDASQILAVSNLNAAGA